MLERLAHRLAGSVLIWDLLLTMVCLRVASELRLWLSYGNSIEPEQVQLPWQIYLVVAVIWIVIFLLLTPQRAIFSPLCRLIRSVEAGNYPSSSWPKTDVTRLKGIEHRLGIA